MERKLISAADFKRMARKHAPARDFDGIVVFKASALGLKADPDPTRKIIDTVMSNDHLDREGDSISLSGWTIDNYLKNPVVLWAHDHSGLPIAKAIEVWREGDDLMASDDFTEAAVIHPFSNTVHAMIVARLLSAVSVGFQPSEWDATDTGMKFLKQDLLEHSVCPVPAHPEALVVARSKGIDIRPLRDWSEHILDIRDDGLATPIRRQAEALWRASRRATGRRTLPPIGRKADEPIETAPEITTAFQSLTDFVLSLPVEERLAALIDVEASYGAFVEEMQAAADSAPGDGQRARRRRTAPRQDQVIVDGDPLPDADDFERAFAQLTAADIRRVIEEEVSSELMRVTGRVFP